MPLRGGGTIDVIFGSSTDGTAVANGITTFIWASLVGSTYTLNKDIYLRRLTVNSGVTINSNGFRIYAQEKILLQNTAKIHNNGASATGTTGAASGGTGTLVHSLLTPFMGPKKCGFGGDGQFGTGENGGGADYAFNQVALGGDGGHGGLTAAGAGGLGGSLWYGPSAGGYGSFLMMTQGCISGYFGVYACGIGAGGGGGSGAAGLFGRGGGGGGAPVLIVASEIDISAGGVIESNGGNGGTGTGIDVADGGGGGGGVVVVTCGSFIGGYSVSSSSLVTSGAGTIQTNKGLKGTLGSTNATDGFPGKVLVFQVG